MFITRSRQPSNPYAATAAGSYSWTVASPDLLSQVRHARRQLRTEGPPRTRPVEDDFLRVTVPERDCDAIRDILISEEASTVIEIGLAYGSSALAIGEALVTVGGHRLKHVMIDAFQESAYENAGWEVVRGAGLGDIATLITEPSHLALPRLVSEEFTADAAYVDGSHIFHNVFVDLSFLRFLVRPGGLVIVDDHWWPSVAAAARYFETNLGWQPLAEMDELATVSPDTGEIRTRALRLPDPPQERGFKDFVPFG